MPTPALALDLLIALVPVWVLIGLAGLLRPLSTVYIARILFPAGALVGLGVTFAGALAVVPGALSASAVLPLGLPGLPFHLRLDALAGFFLVLLGLASAGISIFAAGYFRAGEGAAPGLLGLQYHTFLAAMAAVILADDAYFFMVAWETMALASYFLVTTQHRIAEIRRAGFLYLLIAHVGAIGILLCFGVLQGGSWQFTFDAMRQASLSPAWAAMAFLLALFGFGAKAGLVPLHVWLPEAHPAAPSPVSALMSGVMLKTAIYGFVRVCFDLLHDGAWWWGTLAITLGLVTALYGVVHATVQTDMKRLLAWSSIENVGLIFAGLGLALLFRGFGLGALAALALTAALVHALNHALFKSLLFLATGAVLHATHERNLGRLGGLIRRMPWVAGLALIGTLAIAGLPPLNGFVSEWLLLQAFLFTPGIPQAYANMLIPLGAAAIALIAALAGYAMVKFYGVIFLGQPREAALAAARDAGPLERLGLAWLAAGCVLLGVLPQFALMAVAGGTRALVGATVNLAPSPWWIAPVAAERASYGGLLLLAGILAVTGITALVVHRLYNGRMRRTPAWDCGYPWQTPRMQDSAEGFGQPIRHVFAPLFRLRRELPSAFDTAPRYRMEVEDRFWALIYQPIATAVQSLATGIGRLQGGRLAVYLLYSFLTLVGLLVFML